MQICSQLEKLNNTSLRKSAYTALNWAERPHEYSSTAWLADAAGTMHIRRLTELIYGNHTLRKVVRCKWHNIANFYFRMQN